MFLLIPLAICSIVFDANFTFHNVSINSAYTEENDSKKNSLYIPQCFY